jgi:NAD(P)-dependent dehydrogenase (short-subunit alcohol dehydrogenase family)
MSVFDIRGRCAVVVGMGGIGREIALGLAALGAHVATADLDAARAREAAEAVRRLGVEAVDLRVDVTDERSVAAAADEAVAAFSRVDILVNAVGVTVRKRAEDLPVADWRRILDVNATGTFICCQRFGARMAAGGGGAIVNVSSVRGRFGAEFGQAEYSASKGAVDSLTRSLAAQWAGLGIRVNAVAPTFVETDLTRGARRRAVRRQAAGQHPHGQVGRGGGRRRPRGLPRLPGRRLRDRPDPLCRRGPHGEGLNDAAPCLTSPVATEIMFASWILCSASRSDIQTEGRPARTLAPVTAPGDA